MRKRHRNRLLMFRTFLIIFIIGSFFYSSCNKESKVTSRADKEVTLPLNLPTPVPPEGYNREEALNYIFYHFWDSLDRNDTTLLHDSDFIEQNFANYALFLSHTTDPVKRKEGIKNLMESLQSDTVAYNLMGTTAYHYLYDPNSPMYSEESFIPFMEVLETSPIVDAINKTRISFLLENARKNRPGTRAADFSFITREGKKTSLHSLPSENDILLMFYDPDCDSCHDRISRMKKSEVLAELIDNGSLIVVAVYSGENREAWKNNAGDLPKNWIVGYEPGSLEDKELYYFRASPTFYLLNKDKQVINKDFLPGLW